jgi:hypothetical protein
MASILERFEAKFEKTEGCWEWKASKNHKGYGMIGWNGKVVVAHRVSYSLYTAPIPKGNFQIMHSCDNPGCVNPAHLSLGTQRLNSDDMVAKNRASRNQFRSSKLTVDQVGKIKWMISKRISDQKIGDQFGVHRSTIYLIRSGIHWENIPMTIGE